MACFRDLSSIKHRQKPSKTQVMTMHWRAETAGPDQRFGFVSSK